MIASVKYRVTYVSRKVWRVISYISSQPKKLVPKQAEASSFESHQATNMLKAGLEQPIWATPPTPKAFCNHWAWSPLRVFYFMRLARETRSRSKRKMLIKHCFLYVKSYNSVVVLLWSPKLRCLCQNKQTTKNNNNNSVEAVYLELKPREQDLA